jgi:hypothetical protein
MAETKVTKDELEFGDDWADWTPTFSSLTLGNGTLVAKYTQIGKTIHFYIRWTLGSTSSVGTGGTITGPVVPSSIYTDLRSNLGNLQLFDTSAATTVLGYCRFEDVSTGAIRPVKYTVSGSNIVDAGVTSTVPFTWATGDVMTLQGTYEAA